MKLCAAKDPVAAFYCGGKLAGNVYHPRRADLPYMESTRFTAAELLLLVACKHTSRLAYEAPNAGLVRHLHETMAV